MSTPVTQVDIAAQNSNGSASRTEGTDVFSGPLTLQVKSTFNESVQDQLDDLNAIYGDPSPKLGQVLSLLTIAVDACKGAIDAEDRADKFRADDCMLSVQASVGDLFSYRSVGDGFAIVITALAFMFINKSGLPFTKREMYAVLRTMNGIRTAPFCNLESAVSMTEVLEDAGLMIDPLPLTDLLTEAQEAGFVDT